MNPSLFIEYIDIMASLTGHLDCQYQNHGKLMLGIFPKLESSL